MKNTFIFISVTIAAMYFVKEGKKNAGIEAANLSIAESLKLGIKSTFKTLFDKSEEPAPSEAEIWESEYTNDVVPNHMMQNANDTNLSAFRHILKPKRGNFMNAAHKHSDN